VKILMLYIPLEVRVQEFVRLLGMLKDAGYRVVAAEFTDKIATFKFERGAN
jgi:hypothetical protein